MAGWTKEKMAEESKKIVQSLSDLPAEKQIAQISCAVAFADGTTQTMNVTDLPMHAFLVALQETQLLDRYKKEMKL